MAGRQRILVVATEAGRDELDALRDDLGRHPVCLVAPGPEAARVAAALGVMARAETLLAAVTRPGPDRGHELDALVRRHAFADRYRDVVVVTDRATATLLLRALAPGQLASGAVTVVGLPRGDRPVDVRRALLAGVVLAVLASIAPRSVPPLAPWLAAVGLSVVLLVSPWRHLGREVLLAVGVAVVVTVLAVASSTRFPAGW